jgi:DNA-directed RNA polymerase sigma subunit (sigma70/sigma32)
MARSLAFLTAEDDAWPSDDGWPYPDDDAVTDERDLADPDADVDDDLVALHAVAPHLFDDLEPLERRVVIARFGLDGRPARSMRDLALELGRSRADLRVALGGGLEKLRSHLRPVG